MLNSDLVIQSIPLPIYRDYRILNKNITRYINRITVMIPIDEDDEILIDNIDKSTITFTRGNRTFSVTMRDIYCYGEVDFKDENTINQIDNFKFLDYLNESGVPIYSRYNYDTHSCNTPKNRWVYSCTTSSEVAVDPFI